MCIHRLCHHKTCIVLILENFNSLERIFGKKGNSTNNYLLCSLSSIFPCHFLECYTFIKYYNTHSFFAYSNIVGQWKTLNEEKEKSNSMKSRTRIVYAWNWWCVSCDDIIYSIVYCLVSYYWITSSSR